MSQYFTQNFKNFDYIQNEIHVLITRNFWRVENLRLRLSPARNFECELRDLQFYGIRNSQNFWVDVGSDKKITPENRLISDSSNKCCDQIHTEPKSTPISLGTARKITTFCEVASCKERGCKIFYFSKIGEHSNF